MITDPAQFAWKNFNLNIELHISGNFIYNGIYLIDRYNQLRYEDDCFMLLYDISVGIERLEKIVYLLLAHKFDNTMPIAKLIKQFKNHNHVKLYELINQYISLNFGSKELALLRLLSEFYSKGRYIHLDYDENIQKLDLNKNKKQLFQFFDEFLNIKSANFITENSVISLTDEIKKIIGETISNIVTPIYSVICDTAHQLGIFTSEIRYESKSFKIFVEKEFTFEKEHIAQREILLHLFHSDKDEYLNKLQSISPIELGLHPTEQYVSYLMDFTNHTEIKDEISQVYEDNEDAERANIISFIGNGSVEVEHDLDDELSDSDVLIQCSSFEVKDIFDERVYKNGNRKVFVRQLTDDEIVRICNDLNMFKYYYNGKTYIMLVNNGHLTNIGHSRVLSRCVFDYIYDQIKRDCPSRDYRNAFLNGFRKIVSAKKIKECCPVAYSTTEFDHAVGMCVDHIYRNLYIKDETIKYLQENDFVFTKPKESRYGFYYKHCATTENYVIVDIVTSDEQKSLYVFDLLLVSDTCGKLCHPYINGNKYTKIIYGFDILKNRKDIEEVLK